MTKIPLLLMEDFRPYVEATIQAPHVFGRVFFIIDTGSADTIMSEGNAMMLKIPIKKLIKGNPIMGWGGSSYDSFIFKNVTINFKTDGNQIFQVHLSEISVSQLTTKMTEDKRQISLSFPSVIGTNLLKNNGLLLHFDPSKSIAYLEKVE